jgi:hypothetical protein
MKNIYEFKLSHRKVNKVLLIFLNEIKMLINSSYIHIIETQSFLLQILGYIIEKFHFLRNTKFNILLLLISIVEFKSFIKYSMRHWICKYLYS